MVVMGSGGHTTEMLRITKHLNKERYTPRVYIVSSTDTTTISRVLAGEDSSGTYTICKIPRSREVKQSYLTSIFTTALSTVSSFPVVLWHRPQLVLCNGPGVCIPICAVVFLAKALFLIDARIVFVESLCRVKSFSLTGKILMFFADKILVQWPDLCKVSKRADYIGRL
ncbi:hypothetical protein AAG570_003517 [Ranatra chinensis]|uniref:UDP-N-acetylglucosamine transferase subunit ALG14 n=1 Tax=Ranatra chinensis TaxID=642074 RepID=A0ABD0Y3V2_9HEMI